VLRLLSLRLGRVTSCSLIKDVVKLRFLLDRKSFSTLNFKLAHPGTRELLPKWVGPFKVVERVGQVAYKVMLPPNLKMHNVFHVQLLKPYRDDGRVQPPPPPIEIDDSLEYEVERVLGHREVKRGKQIRKELLVQWLGYEHEHNTWEPEKNLTHCEDLLADHWASVATSKRCTREASGAQEETESSGTRTDPLRSRKCK
jgi:hypothetical protein